MQENGYLSCHRHCRLSSFPLVLKEVAGFVGLLRLITGIILWSLRVILYVPESPNWDFSMVLKSGVVWFLRHSIGYHSVVLKSGFIEFLSITTGIILWS